MYLFTLLINKNAFPENSSFTVEMRRIQKLMTLYYVWLSVLIEISNLAEFSV